MRITRELNSSEFRYLVRTYYGSGYGFIRILTHHAYKMRIWVHETLPVLLDLRMNAISRTVAVNTLILYTILHLPRVHQTYTGVIVFSSLDSCSFNNDFVQVEKCFYWRKHLFFIVNILGNPCIQIWMQNNRLLSMRKMLSIDTA